MLTLDAIAEISRSVALERGRALQVVGVTATDGGAGRAEILVTIEGCHRDPCRFLINISRAEGEEFEREFRAELRKVLRAHGQQA
jgi:hypothetical protein